eukprot:10391825-Alexandrium_andersonii.AAC.1
MAATSGRHPVLLAAPWRAMLRLERPMGAPLMRGAMAVHRPRHYCRPALRARACPPRGGTYG